MHTCQQLQAQAVDTSEHQTKVTTAALRYIQSDVMTIVSLARAFNVTCNTINNWLCEAVAKNYIPSLTMCKQLICKHVLEYEIKHNIKNSSLRQMYETALEERNAKLAIDV